MRLIPRRPLSQPLTAPALSPRPVETSANSSLQDLSGFSTACFPLPLTEAVLHRHQICVKLVAPNFNLLAQLSKPSYCCRTHGVCCFAYFGHDGRAVCCVIRRTRTLKSISSQYFLLQTTASDWTTTTGCWIRRDEFLCPIWRLLGLGLFPQKCHLQRYVMYLHPILSANKRRRLLR